MSTKPFLLAIIISILMMTKIIGKTSVSIQKAFDKKYITAKAICKGGLELNYSVCNLLKDTLAISIPAGWRFNSNDPKNDYQDILMTREEILTLKPKENKVLDIKGYCCEVTKSGPIAGIAYTSGKMADSNLVKLARYLNQHPFDKNTEQYSVWAISDRKETANITSTNDSIASILRTFVAGLKGEPLPWYTLLKRASISNSGTVNDHPIKFKANINYNVTQTCYTYCYIVDAKGNKVSTIIGQWLQPDSSTHKTNFNVSGLKKGDYTLILENKNTALFEKSFKI